MVKPPLLVMVVVVASVVVAVVVAFVGVAAVFFQPENKLVPRNEGQMLVQTLLFEQHPQANGQWVKNTHYSTV